jgi:hypothetical protein
MSFEDKVVGHPTNMSTSKKMKRGLGKINRSTSLSILKQISIGEKKVFGNCSDGRGKYVCNTLLLEYFI